MPRCPMLSPIYFIFIFLALFTELPLKAQVRLREAVEAASKQYASIVDSRSWRDLDGSCAEMSLVQSTHTSSVAGPSAWAGSQDTPSDVDAASGTVLSPAMISLSANSAAARSRASAPVPADRGDHNTLCAALAYVELTTINSQTRILQDQQAAADRLVETETRRASKAIDDPMMLTRARLLQARARFRAAALKSSERRVREQLADLAGLPIQHVKLASSSMAPLPDVSIADSEVQAAIRQMITARDIAQLEHALAHTKRMSTRGRMVVGKANVGDLLTAYIAEQEKLVELLGADFALQSARLSLLEATGALERWAEGSPAIPTENMSSETTPRESVSVAARASPSIRWIMITPAVSALLTGESQKFSAIVIYDDGHAKDASSEATWVCSSDSGAVVSTSGLVTAFAAGHVTITAKVSSVQQSRQIDITSYGIDSVLKE